MSRKLGATTRCSFSGLYSGAGDQYTLHHGRGKAVDVTARRRRGGLPARRQAHGASQLAARRAQAGRGMPCKGWCEPGTVSRRGRQGWHWQLQPSHSRSRTRVTGSCAPRLPGRARLHPLGRPGPPPAHTIPHPGMRLLCLCSKPAINKQQHRAAKRKAACQVKSAPPVLLHSAGWPRPRQGHPPPPSLQQQGRRAGPASARACSRSVPLSPASNQASLPPLIDTHIPRAATRVLGAAAAVVSLGKNMLHSRRVDLQAKISFPLTCVQTLQRLHVRCIMAQGLLAGGAERLGLGGLHSRRCRLRARAAM
jgi:hypothetical protein